MKVQFIGRTTSVRFSEIIDEALRQCSEENIRKHATGKCVSEQKIGLIKLVRDFTGAGLRESKGFIDGSQTAHFENYRDADVFRNALRYAIKFYVAGYVAADFANS